jgi:uncharacterized membrane protein
MNSDLSTIAYLKSAQVAGNSMYGMNEILMPAIITGVVVVVFIVVCMIIYDTIVSSHNDEDDTYNNKL